MTTPRSARTSRAHHRRTAAAAALALTGALALGACSTGSTGSTQHDAAQHKASAEHEQGLEVTGAYMPEPLMTDMAGGYFVVENHGTEDDRLTKVTSDIAGSVDMHRTSDGQMQRVDSLPVPAGGELELSRGGNHLMFHDLTRKPAEGDTVRVELHFAEHGTVTVKVPVEATNHDPAHSGHHH